MEQKSNLPKPITLFDKIKLSIMKAMGYKECGKFILDTEPILRNYSDIELSRLADKEEKLKEALKQNESEGKLVEGISKEDAESVLEWVVQNARAMLIKDYKMTKEEFQKEESLRGCCGYGQALTGFPLIHMGLTPNTCNTRNVFDENSAHAFLTVEIPVKDEQGTVTEKEYLVDTTYRQFYDRTLLKREGYYIKDKNFGNKVSETPGYYTLKMKNGKEFAEELLAKGFVELTEENAKMYGDSFVLSHQTRKDYTKVPTKREEETSITGEQYIENIHNPELHMEIDNKEEDLEKNNINTKTPLMEKEGERKIQKLMREKYEESHLKNGMTEKNVEVVHEI